MIALKLSPTDSVAVALDDITPGDTVSVDGQQLPATTAVPAGHKIALYPIAAGEDVIKYGWPIGHATADVAAGAWVHSHNLTTNLGANLDYIYQPTTPTQTTPPSSPLTFAGYHRANGDVGVRNDLFIVPTVGCINGTVDAIARQFEAQGIGPFTSVVVARHPHGCSQLGGDLANTRLILQDVIRHPNAGGALVVGLGCENNQLDQLREGLGEYDEQRVKFMITQDVEDEYAAAAALLQELRDAAQNDTRTETPLSQLRIGLKCGGSDGFSGITANRLLGHFSDYLIAQGGSAVLTEVPEMFGAEHLLMGRARSQVVFDDIVDMINGFKDYFRRYNQPIYENPSPGNKQGGITTLEEKSLGCT
ncbi:MAG: altronate dehydratase family protein, partial [Propionibacteriaceae bacterium]|nr:altronate dehydratase family protein [Propionibacteriaceae bacterium]